MLHLKPNSSKSTVFTWIEIFHFGRIKFIVIQLVCKSCEFFFCHYQILLSKSNGVVIWNIQPQYGSAGYFECASFWFNDKRIWFVLSTCYVIKTLSYQIKRTRETEKKFLNLMNHNANCTFNNFIPNKKSLRADLLQNYRHFFRCVSFSFCFWDFSQTNSTLVFFSFGSTQCASDRTNWTKKNQFKNWFHSAVNRGAWMILFIHLLKGYIMRRHQVHMISNLKQSENHKI